MFASTIAHPPGRQRRFASPLARALAREKGLDLESITGSGPNGRIVRADLVARQQPGGASEPSIDATAMPAFDEIPNSISRKLMARRLTESKQQAPHFTVRVDCDLDALLLRRAEIDKTQRVRLSVNDFVIKAAALALRAVPAVNASYTETAIRRYRAVNIAVAVAVEEGLVTPVIEDADQKSLVDISAALQDLASRARSGRLPFGALRGGTFSVSNLGSLGVREFAAVINPPQGAILAVGMGETRAVVRNGVLAVATMMSVTLSVDHRAIDGAVAARWLASFKNHLENPLSLEVSKASLDVP